MGPPGVLRPSLDRFQVTESDFQGYRPGKHQIRDKNTDSTLEIEENQEIYQLYFIIFRIFDSF